MSSYNMDNFYNKVCEHGYYSKPKRLKFYLEQQLFKGIDFKNKSLIDIGGGRGLFGYYAALKGASKVTIMEPEFDGSTSGMIKDFHHINEILDSPDNINLTTEVLEDFDRKNNQYDYILMHNAINHIDEDACIDLKENPESQVKYLAFLKKMQEISHDKTILIVCDCARSNFWGNRKLKNRFAPTIEWEKHQNPQFWIGLLEKAGYTLESIKWSTPNFAGYLGKLFLSNQLVSYLTYSHFRIVLRNNVK